MKKIKILYEGLSTNLGGIENFIYNLYKNIDKEKYEISFLIDKGLKIAYYEKYKIDGCKFFEVENRKKSYWKYLKDLKSIYQNNKFDIIHINVMSYSLFERITYACKYSDAKVIVHSHSSGYKTGYFRTRSLHLLGKFMVKKQKFNKVACGKKAGDFLFGNEKYDIFYNGIDIQKFSFSKQYRQEIRRKLCINDNETVITLVAGFFPVKNHEFLIDIVNEYLKLNSNMKLLLIGEGQIKSQIEEKVKKLNIQKNVIFLGKREDVYKMYSASDIYLMPSISEGLSMSIIEAQINGLKCYTSDGVDENSDISGNIERISLQKTPKEWATYIYTSNNDRDYNILKKIPEEYNSNKSIEVILNYYNTIIK